MGALTYLGTAIFVLLTVAMVGIHVSLLVEYRLHEYLLPKNRFGTGKKLESTDLKPVSVSEKSSQSESSLNGVSSSFYRRYAKKEFTLQTPSWSFIFGDITGFFSQFNNAAMLCAAAWVEGIPCHIIIDLETTHASAFTMFLEDIARESVSPFFLFKDGGIAPPSANSTEYSSLSSNGGAHKFLFEAFSHGYDAKTMREPTQTRKHYLARCFNGNMNLFRGTLEQLQKVSGKRKLFLLESEVTQALWQLSDNLRREIDAMEQVLVGDRRCRNFLVVHLRRGDKENFLETSYLEKLLEFILSQPDVYCGDSIPVYVMSDDEVAAQNLIRQMKVVAGEGGISLAGFTWLDLIGQLYKAGNRRTESGMLYSLIMYYQTKFGALTGGGGYSFERVKEQMHGNAEAKLYLTHAILSATAVATRAKNLVGTFSSNQSRFVAMFVGLNQTFSLDYGWESVL